MPYRVININYSVTCYTNHINSIRIQSIASMALMVFSYAIRHPLPHLAAAHQWTLVPQTHAPNLVERGFSATIVRGLVISHTSAHSHADPSNNNRPGLHSNKEAIPMMRESMLCTGCPLQKCRTFSKIYKTRDR